MKKAFLSILKVQALQNSIAFLETYAPPPNEEHHIGSSLEDVNEMQTELLKELGSLNLRRVHIIQELMKNS